jgi:5'-3' exoribonuclease 1
MHATELQKQSSYLEMIQDIMSQTSTNVSNYDTGEDDDDDNDNENGNGRFVSGWQPVTQAGEKDFKGRYYFEKLQLTPLHKQEHWELRKAYVEGLLWCLAYYYKGCISWGWFYPYPYGPMLSDLMDLPKMFGEISFDMGTPLTPFEQLMGCLPPASAVLVPPLYRPLMTAPTSPILQFYPENFKVDMNGKKNPWEGVNLLPFIDVDLLKKTIAAHCPASKLSAVERKRNTFGKVYAFRYDVSCNDTVPSPNQQIGLPDIVSSHSSVCVLEDASTTNYQQEASLCFQPQLVPGTRVPYPGFPLLNVLPVASVELTPLGLNCFGMPSKHSTTVLTLHPMPELPALEVLANNVLGKSLFINWPMMHEGKVVAISNNEKEIRLAEDRKTTTTTPNNKNKKQPQQQHQEPQSRFVTKIHTEGGVDKWYATSEAMHQMYLMGNGIPGSGGVQIGPVHVRLKLLPLRGMDPPRNSLVAKKPTFRFNWHCGKHQHPILDLSNVVP